MKASIVLSPQFGLFIEGEEVDNLGPLKMAFDDGPGTGLLFLDVASDAVTEEPAFAYWKDFARLYLSLFAATPEIDDRDLKSDPVRIALHPDDLDRFLAMVPPMKGSEYVNEESLTVLWRSMETAIHREILRSGKSASEYFAKSHKSLNLLGRVCFHLAENKNSPDAPFAFLATYAHQVSKKGKAQHLPLSRALDEYAEQKSVLLRLLSPIQKAAKESSFLLQLVRAGDIYEALAWSPREAYRFLKDIPVFEKAGIAVRVPNWWNPKQPHRPQVAFRLGEKKPPGVSFNALLDFSMSVVLGEQELSQKEIQHLLEASDNLVFFRGQWVEVDREKLNDILGKWRRAAKNLGDGISFGEAMRLLSGVDTLGDEKSTDEERSWSRVISGKWLAEMLDQIRSPEIDRQVEEILKTELQAELRPYQKQGVTWLHRLYQLRLGGILADDMGLGKTVQVIALLLIKKHLAGDGFNCLLVVPASLIGNWKSELTKFAPSLKYWIAHPSGDGYSPAATNNFDISITTYGSLAKLKWASAMEWGAVIADEAQAVKNPGAKQTKALKALNAKYRLALTGTPVENHLSDLWSLFDFVSPGLLGSAKEFESFVKRKTTVASAEVPPYAALRRLVKPYILRRLKTHKNVIRDLPEKTELKCFCQLSQGQAALYQRAVQSMAQEIDQTEGIKRRGVIFAYLMRFKQICNHPSQLVKDGLFREADSGKFQRLREICEVIAEKQEKVIIFSQFKEIIEPLNAFLTSIFGKAGLILHGETAVKKRAQLMEEFQRDGGPPYFILSLKAGGTGLNLTAASHVIHFDRWWNPAVENQATDRAFRIGQKKNVLVHKFICRGTLEEKIDALIESKNSMSSEILEEDGATLLTEMNNRELLKIVELDIHSAATEN
ncbi:MAG: ATP-dependent helicase [Bdellovibrio sp.]|nr:MAG: ATP-dependent helicase [Bdellovibrio sp.]